MNKLLVIGGLATLALAGCAAPAPANTVTVTATPAPLVEETATSTTPREDLEFYLIYLGAPSWALTPDSLDILVDVANDTCDAIDSGMSQEEIAYTAALAGEGADQDVIDVFLMATVAATYTYCPEHEGFFE